MIRFLNRIARDERGTLLASETRIRPMAETDRLAWELTRERHPERYV